MRNFSLLLLLICLSCNSQNKTERVNEPTIYNLESEDVEINRAIKTAQQTLTKFEKAIRSNKEHETGSDRIAEAIENIECDIILNVQFLLRPPIRGGLVV